MISQYISLAILLGLVIFLAVRLLQISKQRNDEKATHIKNEAYLEECKNNVEKANLQIAKLQSELDTLNNEKVKLSASVSTLSFDNQRLNHELTSANEKLTDFQRQVTTLNAQNAENQANLNAQQELYAKQQELFNQSQQKLEEQLKVMANKFLKTGTEDLTKASKEHMTNVVTPLKEELEIFKKLIHDNQEKNAERQGQMLKEIKTLEESHTTLSKQAEDLTKALRSGGKSQGMWGELQLERVLDASGLTKGIEYEREVAGNRALGEMGRPDAIIKLPQNHCLIIDAKCSLTAYTNYINATDDAEKQNFLKEHVASIKAHINELIKKDYSSYLSLKSPSFVFMFVPIDAALTEALSYDATLYDTASNNRIYLVSPSSMLPALRVVSNLWILAEQSDRMRELARIAKQINDKFDVITNSFEKMYSYETKLREEIDGLHGRVLSGKGNLKSLLERFDKNATKEFKELDGMVIDAKEDDPSFTLENK